MNKTFIFDYDDTLAYNMFDYSLAELKFLEWVIRKLGPRSPNTQEIINLEVQIDKTAVKTMGFSMKRFPTSFMETYKQICETLGLAAKKEDLETAYDLGMLAFNEKAWEERGLVPGATKTLDFLVEQKDELLLLTKGDYEVQKKKLKATGCEKWFGDLDFGMRIAPNKDKSVILDFVGSRDKSRVWHVGNSIRSDVEPALEAGIGMIYIPFETWAWEKEHNGKPEHPRLKTIKSIIEIKDIYYNL